MVPVQGYLPHLSEMPDGEMLSWEILKDYMTLQGVPGPYIARIGIGYGIWPQFCGSFGP